MELWKAVQEAPLYEVSSSGKVRNTNTGRLLSPGLVNGYPKVVISTPSGLKVNRLVHRLVAQAFLPNPLNLPEVNHKDEIKTNPKLSNLEWCTEQYNSEYSNAKVYTLVNPDGDVVVIRNLLQFSKLNGLNSSHLRSVFLGNRKTHKGWSVCHGA